MKVMKCFGILICLLSIFVGSCNNLAKSGENRLVIEKKETLLINGFFNSFNNDSLLLFKTIYPDFIEGEAHIGELRLLNINQNKSVALFDSIDVNIANAVFFSDSIILVPYNNNIWAYNILKNESIGAIFNLSKDDGLFGFSLQPSKRIFATVLVNFKNRTSELIIYNLFSKKKESIIIPYDFEDTEYYPTPEFYWINGGKILFFIQNKLYIYNEDNKKIATISGNLESEFDNSRLAINDQEVIFRAGNNLYKLDFDSMERRAVNDFKTSTKTEFYTGRVEDKYKSFLKDEGLVFEYTKNSFQKVAKLKILENNALLIYRDTNDPTKFFVEKK